MKRLLSLNCHVDRGIYSIYDDMCDVEVQSLVLSGRIGEAIMQTQHLYTGLLECNTELLFTLQCRQFVEIVNGTEGETVPTELTPLVRRVRRTLRPRHGDRPNPVQSSPRNDPCSRTILTSLTTMPTNGAHSTNGASLGLSSSAVTEKNTSSNSSNGQHVAIHAATAADIDVDMDTLEHDEKSVTNGSSRHGGCVGVNGSSDHVTYCTDDSSNSADEQDYSVAQMGECQLVLYSRQITEYFLECYYTFLM